MDVDDFLKNGHQQFLPNLSIDHVIIGYEHGALKCLLLKLGGSWVLPGGFISRDESVEQEADRILKDRTALDSPHMKFLAVFGDKDRQFGQQWKQFVEKMGYSWRDDYWINERFVTLAYYSLVDIELVDPKAGVEFEEVAWFDFENLPEMMLDHSAIALTARERLKTDINNEMIAFKLLPEIFTMPELHQLYQTILEKEIDRSRFQKNMLGSGWFERLPKREDAGPGRNPFLYRVNED